MLLKEQKLNTYNIQISPLHAATIMMVSGGYPGTYEKGKSIHGLMTVKDSLVFHAGTREGRNGNILTNGGRVIALTSLGKTLKEAFDKSYLSAEKIQFDGKYYRSDLGRDVM
jgi:phosphoribosylamine--glycine ligase